MKTIWLSVAFVAAGRVGAAETAPDRWDRFVILVWQYHTPPPGPEATKAYARAGLHGLHLDGGFSQKLLDFAIAGHYPFYVGHAAGKGDLYLRRGDWDRFFAAYRRNRRHPVRPHCLRDPAVRARLKRNLKQNITRARVGPVIAYAFDDEISITSFTSPADVCWSARCLAAFRAWLRKRYGTLARLNAEWGTNYSRFDEARPRQVDDLRHFHAEPLSRWNLAPWADHRTFMDDTFAEVLAGLTRFANELDPRTPAGFVGGQAPAAYGGYDYAKLCRAVQWMEAYDLGGTNEILRSFWDRRKPHVQTYFSSFKPPVDKWFLWYYFVHGNRGVICWPARGRTPWFQGSSVRPEIRALAPTYRELTGDLGTLLVDARLDADPVGIYYSQPSIQVSWFMDIQPHGATWINRSSSLNNANASDILDRLAWLKLLEDCGIQGRFVSYLDVQEGKETFAGLKVLILPRVLALSDAEALAIRRFVRRGGALIADYLPGVFDEHGKARARGVLDDLFSVTRDLSQGVLDGKTVAEVNGEFYQRPLAERLSYDGAFTHTGFVAYERGLHPGPGAAAQTAGATNVLVTHRVGSGHTRYLNLTPLPYLLKRRQPAGEAYRDLIRSLLHGAGVDPRVEAEVDGRPDPTMERLFWRKGRDRYLCVVRNVLRGAKIDGMGPTDAVSAEAHTLTLRFRRPVAELTNVRTGANLSGGRVVKDRWVECEANVYRLKG